MAALVSKRYAKAIFDIAVSKDLVDKIESELQLIVDTLSENQQLKELISHPKITFDERKNIIESIFSSSLTEDTLNFVSVLLEKGREKFLPNVLEEYIYFSDSLKNVIRATVYSVVELDEVQMNLIRLRLAEKLSKSVILSNKIDASLIGGIYIKAADQIIDGSVKGKLNELKKLMLA